MDGLQARLFSRLREQHQEWERLRLIVSYRRQFRDALLRQLWALEDMPKAGALIEMTKV